MEAVHTSKLVFICDKDIEGDILDMTEQQIIGQFIKKLREQRQLTQDEFAKALDTSQSAVARMERGEQNFTMDTLNKISRVLDHQIINLSDSVDFEIQGGRKLHGTIVTNASKNGALGLMFASLLNKNTTLLHGIPRIEEVNRIIEVFESIGISVKWQGDKSLQITPPNEFDLSSINSAAAKKTRSVLMMIGPLIHRIKKFNLPSAGGCRMGERTIAGHRYGFEELGVDIKSTEEGYEVYTKKLKPSEIVMYEQSDTATENLLMAAALIPGKTTIRFAPPNYQVQDVCHFLESLGVKIDGIGTTTLIVHGVEEINREIEYHNSEDPIESMMFITAAIVTGSELKVKRCPVRFLELELTKLKHMGLKYDQSDIYLAKNEKTELVDITVYPSKLYSLRDKIHAQPYPGINSDNLPFFVPIATQTKGMTLVHDWMWENRAVYYTELNKLGADVTLADPHRVFIKGPTKLNAAQVVCPPALRPAVIILISMLAAEGKSILRNVYSISRGYEEIAARLNSIGAKINVYTGL